MSARGLRSWSSDGVDRSKDARRPAKVASGGAACRLATSRSRPDGPIVRCGPSRRADGRVRRHPEEPVPDPPSLSRPPLSTRSGVGDLAAVVAPPYDVIDPGAARAPDRATPGQRRPPRSARPRSTGDEPDDRYRRAARTLAAWRSDGTLRKDPHPSLYVYEQSYRVPGHGRRARPARLLRPAAAGAVRPRRASCPHERTMAGPKEDRYKLLRATGRQHQPRRRAVRRPARAGRGGAPGGDRRAPAEVDVVDDDGVRHRLWIVPADGDGRRPGRRPRSGPPEPARSRSPTATTATRRPFATATSAG